MNGLEQTFYHIPTKGYAKIPHAVYELELDKKPDALLVIFFLARRRNNKTGQCNPSRTDIAKHIGISTKQITRGLKALEKKNVIRVLRKRGISSQYVLNPVSKWDWSVKRAIRVRTGSP